MRTCKNVVRLAGGPLRQKEVEPVIYPDAFDKFVGGELQAPELDLKRPGKPITGWTDSGKERPERRNVGPFLLNFRLMAV
jgi:hypothetical protein